MSLIPFAAPLQVLYQGTLTGLRISSVNGTAFIDNAITQSTELSLAVAPVLHSGSVTQANMKLSTVNGTAFVDSNAGDFATNITAHLGKYLKITDSAGKSAYAWIKAAGTGETFGADLTNGSFAADSDWTKGTDWSIAAGIASCALVVGAYNQIHQAKTYTQRALYYSSVDLTVTSGESAWFVGDSANQRNYTTTGTKTQYFTIPTTAAYDYFTVRGMTGFAGSIDNAVSKQVTAPSSAGVTLTSTKNGSTYNFESIDTGFNPNDASGYTYVIYDRDITALADGNHLIEIYDASNRKASGVMSAAGTVETLGGELVTNGDFASDVGWSLQAGLSVSGGVLNLVSVIGNNAAYQNKLSVGALYKASFTVTGYTSGNVFAIFGNGASPGTYHTSAATFTDYGTATDLYLGIAGSNSATGTVDDYSHKSVTAPSAAGSLIVAAKGSATQNFGTIQSGFTLNQTSYAVRIIRLR